MMGYDELERVLGKAASEYAAACKKHPVFPTRVSPVLVSELKGQLAQVRADNEGDAGNRFSVHSVQAEEALEALIEARRGNYAQAKLETLHLIATALRAYEFYDEMERGSSAKSPFTNGRKNDTIRGMKTPMKSGGANER